MATSTQEMRITKTTIGIDMTKPEIKQITSYNVATCHPYSTNKINRLKNGIKNFDRIITGEPYVFTCDGSCEFYDNTKDYEVPYLSSQLATSSGLFDAADKPSITMNFSSMINEPFFNVCFNDTFPVDFTLKLFSGSTVVHTYTQTEETLDGFYKAASGGKRNFVYPLPINYPFNKLVMTFNEMDLGYSRVRISEMVIGVNLEFSKELTNCTLTCETDMMSNKIPIGLLEFNVSNCNDLYNHLDKRNIFNLLKEDQSVYCFTTIKRGPLKTHKNLGRYYLKSFSIDTRKDIKFVATDIIGLFEKTRYFNDLSFSSTFSYSTLFDSVFRKYSSINYHTFAQDAETTASLALTARRNISGENIREALQCVLIASNLALRVIDGDKVEIFKPLHIPSTTTLNRVICNSQVSTIRQPITGVSAEFFHFKEATYPEDKTLVFNYLAETKNVIKNITLLQNETDAERVCKYWYNFMSIYNVEIKYSAFLDFEDIIGQIIKVKNEIGVDFAHLVTFVKTDLLKGFLSEIEGVGKL